MVSRKLIKLYAFDLILMMMRIMRMTAMMTTMTIPITRILEDPVEAVFTFFVGASVCSSACDWSMKLEKRPLIGHKLKCRAVIGQF